MGFVDETRVEQLVDQRVCYFVLSNRHAHDVLLRARVVLVCIGPFKRVLLDDEVVEAAAKGPDVHGSRHLALTLVLTLL